MSVYDTGTFQWNIVWNTDDVFGNGVMPRPARPEPFEDLDQAWKDFKKEFRDDVYIARDQFIYALQKRRQTVNWCRNCMIEFGTEPLRNGLACKTCLPLFGTCSTCGDRVRRIVHIEDQDYCAACVNVHFTYCERHALYYRNDDADAANAHDHARRTCKCEAKNPSFRIPYEGHDPIESDTRVIVPVAGGIISNYGLDQMYWFLRDLGYIDAAERVYIIGSEWQSSGGNYTKRLSKALYKDGLGKVPPEVLAKLGKVASDHCSKDGEVHLEITKRLNESASFFYHDGSCWWGSYSYSRCTVKTLGGFGLRSFSGVSVNGRAWVLPLKRGAGSSLVPTLDSEHPDAYVVFNGYGALQSYAAPRLLAQISGWSYKKITFTSDRMSVNANSGFLVGPQEMVSRRSRLVINLEDEHINTYERS